ncbi:peptide abc transporter atp-binding protein [Lasius niger]|uniref:Peptide abc transporter atp-binding protein n=1 Tax=Lasius niger TaxID=67767 RepID=A0A0J7N6H1_LASNI|nr:peptide abc transporter atp-binding protein [Lasius niger]
MMRRGQFGLWIFGNPYALGKVLEVFYNGRPSDAVVIAAQSLGHFTSTLHVLSLAGIGGLRAVDAVVQAAGSSVSLTAEAKIQFGSMSADTHRLAIVYEAAKRLVRSISVPQKYHMGASYLTGEPRADYSDTNMNAYLGRLGTFIITLYRNSTLAKSPHMTASRIKSYNYDADFRHMLGRMQAAQAAARAKVMEEQAVVAAPEEAMCQLRTAFGTGAPGRLIPVQPQGPN